MRRSDDGGGGGGPSYPGNPRGRDSAPGDLEAARGGLDGLGDGAVLVARPGARTEEDDGGADRSDLGHDGGVDPLLGERGGSLVRQ